jgi:protein SCO1/2
MGEKIVGGLALSSLLLFGTWGARKIIAPRAIESVRPIPDFRMTGVTIDTEQPIVKADLIGSPWVANFIFTHCGGPCPLLTAEMARLQKELPKEIKLVTLTVDPDRDTPEVLRQYASRFHADPRRWIFMTGEKGALFKLMYEGFNLPMVEDRQSPSGFRVTHSTKFVLVDSQGTIRGYYGQEGLNSISRLKVDALALLKEQS